MKINIGANIKRLRASKGITQEQLADVANVSCAAVSKWERGETLPDITLLQPLAFYFGESIDELMGYDKEKVNEKIERVIDEYWKTYRGTDPEKAREIIVNAYREYPNDYRIMSRYMWDIAGDAADNDPQVLIAHKTEFLGICDRILEGCTDEFIRLTAWNMKAKILHAEGDTAGALGIYEKKFVNWYLTAEQKTEQLFAKNTPEFLRQVKVNALELSAFAADKLCKSIYFDISRPLAERIKKAEFYGKKLSQLAEETEEMCFVVFARSFWGRLRNDIHYRGGGEDAERRAAAEESKLEALQTRLLEADPTYADVWGIKAK